MSPKHVPATVHELSRVGLLRELGGVRIDELARRMERVEVRPGTQLLAEGDDGDRFYVVLAGVLSATQRDRGERGLLRPGDYFGEVALAMGVPRTASVRAVTPATVASCDRETFDEYVRPLFAEPDA